MYSGKEATPNYPTQWALNPLAYQDVDASQVDWASLAQQWIQMKDAAPAVGAVPPPLPKPAKKVSPAESNEGGEAPMDIGNDSASNTLGLGQNQWNNTTGTWPDTWDQWNWSSWPDGAGDMPEAVPAIPFTNYQVTTDIAGYTTAVPPASINPGYWTADAAAAKPDSKTIDTKSRPSSRSDRRRTDRPRNSSSGRSRRLDRNDRGLLPMLPRPPQLAPTSSLLPATIDAAKRRTLPAWIREGLEKMEREKQLKQEREDELRQLEIDRQRKEDEEREMQRIRDQAALDGQPMMPAKSKFDTDSESEGEEKKTDKKKELSPAKNATEPTNTHTTDPAHPHPTHPAHPHPAHPTHPPQLIAAPKSREEVLQEVMLTVRRTLTEILLEVTNDEITSVCQEEVARYRANMPDVCDATEFDFINDVFVCGNEASRAVVDKPKMLAALKEGLGLGIYDDSSASESEEEGEPGGQGSPRSIPRESTMSDAQLQEVIRRRKADFEKTCREIEASIRRDEQRLAAMERQADSGERDREREREKVLKSAGGREKGRAHGEQSTDSSSQSQTPDVTTTPDHRGTQLRDGDTPPPNKNNSRSSLVHSNPENPRKTSKSTRDAIKPETKSNSRKHSVNSQDDLKQESRRSTRDKRTQEKERDGTSFRREVPSQTDRRLYKIKERNESDDESSGSDSDDSDDSEDSGDQSETGSTSSGSSSSESESDSEKEQKLETKRHSGEKTFLDRKDGGKEKINENRRKIDGDNFNIDSIKGSKYDKVDKNDKTRVKDIDGHDCYSEGHKTSGKYKSSRSRSKSYEVSSSIKSSKYDKVDGYDKSKHKQDIDGFDSYPEDRKKNKYSRSRSKSYDIKSEKKRSLRNSREKDSTRDVYRSDSESKVKSRKDKYGDRSREKYGSRERYRDRSRERHRDRSRDRDRSLDRHRDRSRDRERSRESYRSRPTSRDRYRSEDRDKERYRSREKDRERDRRSKRSRSHHRSSYRY